MCIIIGIVYNYSQSSKEQRTSIQFVKQENEIFLNKHGEKSTCEQLLVLPLRNTTHYYRDKRRTL